MGISEKSKLEKRTKWEGEKKKKEILGLKGSITKMKKSLNRYFFHLLSVYPINNAVIV